MSAKEWWWSLFTHMIEIYMVNTWSAYLIANANERPLLLDVRRIIGFLYISKKTEATSKRQGPQENKLMGGQVSTDIRLDPGNHFIRPTKTQKKCA
ncbi:hypothetical protein TNCT_487961 [Trichonephila clavata]|uniref:PiggyBac transposable element-derived protein domain-containing protein n=1 Tax=Trichonephila clavata TaxID=2740835 RepID=A0A8X6L0Q7_TRICU|nr:hypothetical protein TNCT_487961 [Trichonephila clavata]